MLLTALPAPLSARTAPDPADPQEQAIEFEAVRIGGNFEYPWSIAFLPDHSLLLTERPGRLNHLRQDGSVREVAGLPPLFTGGLAGLLDVAVDPDFARNRLIYLSYVAGTEKRSAVRVARARLAPDHAALTAKTVIFESSAAEKPEQYGGRLALSRDGHLFLTLGDRWKAEHAQRLDDTLGTVIRIRTDGSVPADNPFRDRESARPEIWSYGHRVSQGLAFGRSGEALYAIEHGPMGGDEFNRILPGRNYGWPAITHGIGYDGKPVGEGKARDGMEQPLHVFGEPPAQAPSGLAVDGEDAAPVVWVGTLAGQALLRLDRDGAGWRETRLLHEQLGRIRDVRIGPDGLLYVITDDAEGALYRLDPVVEQAGQGRSSR